MKSRQDFLREKWQEAANRQTGRIVEPIKETLESLLAWAKQNGLYIMIFGDGSAEVETDKGVDFYEYYSLCEGENLGLTLFKAKLILTGRIPAED